ncbi:MAG: DUF4386 domain-containing protein [Actinomycetia bacterium]|nr:DUF4386 domain-containing protein [Actinomycetes bacterium]
MNTSLSTRAPAERRGGAPLLVPAAALTGLTLSGAVLGGSGPRPDWTADQVLAHADTHPLEIALTSALLLASAFPLVVYAAVLVTRMRGLGVTSPGPVIGFAGALLAAASLAASALFGWAGAQVALLGDPGLSKVLATLWFGTGGVGFVAPLGLLLLGVAVPALRARLLPAPLGWAAVAVGVAAMLSTFALVSDALYPLLPIGRFGGLLVRLATALLLPHGRED